MFEQWLKMVNDKYLKRYTSQAIHGVAFVKQDMYLNYTEMGRFNRDIFLFKIKLDT